MASLSKSVASNFTTKNKPAAMAADRIDCNQYEPNRLNPSGGFPFKGFNLKLGLQSIAMLGGQTLRQSVAGPTILLGPAEATPASGDAIAAGSALVLLLVIGVLATSAAANVGAFLALTHARSTLAHPLTTA